MKSKKQILKNAKIGNLFMYTSFTCLGILSFLNIDNLFNSHLNLQKTFADNDKNKYEDHKEEDDEDEEDDYKHKEKENYEKNKKLLTNTNTGNLNEQVKKLENLLVSNELNIKKLEEKKLLTKDENDLSLINKKISFYNSLNKATNKKLSSLKQKDIKLDKITSFKAPNNKTYKIIDNGVIVKIQKEDGSFTKQDFKNYQEAVNYLNKNAVSKTVINENITKKVITEQKTQPIIKTGAIKPTIKEKVVINTGAVKIETPKEKVVNKPLENKSIKTYSTDYTTKAS